MLAGCQTGPLASFGQRLGAPEATRAETAGGNVQLIERDIEAPDQFEAKEAALWDGRPSLGGVWIAAPDVTAPERVKIVNAETGKSVVGALFKRERSNPGPKLQLSSEAAAALGVIAGAPTELHVVALKREEAQPPAPVAGADLADAASLDGLVTEADLPETPAALTAAVPEIAASPLDAAGQATAPAAAAVTASAAAPAEVVLENITDTALDGAAEIADPATPLVPDPLPADEAVFAEANATARADALAVATRAVEAALRDAEAAYGGSLPAADVADAAPAPGPAPRAVETAAADGTFIQVGTYADEANAVAVATKLSGAGILPTVRSQEAEGRTTWRVLIGPALSEGDRAEVLRTVRELGYDDAYTVAG